MVKPEYALMAGAEPRMPTIQEYIEKRQLEMTVTRVPHRTDGLMDMGKDARHWLCVIKQVGFGNPHLMTLYFSQGAAHTKAPSLADVLDCLASDASSIQNARDFEEWAGELGYDTDSRKAEETYRQCVAQSRDLERLLGRDGLRELVEGVERL